MAKHPADVFVERPDNVTYFYFLNEIRECNGFFDQSQNYVVGGSQRIKRHTIAWVRHSRQSDSFACRSYKDIMANKQIVIYPNLLLSTTYALNKSASKKASVGLEYDSKGGNFRPVVKLGGGGPPNKYVTLDMRTWDLIVDQMDVMKSYVTKGYNPCYPEFGDPAIIMLQDHVINFTTSYQDKTITIVERPPASVCVNAAAGTIPKVNEPSTSRATSTHEATATSPNTETTTAKTTPQVNAPSDSASSPFTTIAEGDDNARDELQINNTSAATPKAEVEESPVLRPKKLFNTPNAPKRRKLDNTPCFAMQLPTFEGLVAAAESITYRMHKLEDQAIFVNQIYEFIVDYLKKKLFEEEEDERKSILKTPPKFHHFYDDYRHSIEVDIGNMMQTQMTIDKDDVELALTEIYAYYIWTVADDLFTSFFNIKKNV